MQSAFPDTLADWGSLTSAWKDLNFVNQSVDTGQSVDNHNKGSDNIFTSRLMLLSWLPFL